MAIANALFALFPLVLLKNVPILGWRLVEEKTVSCSLLFKQAGPSCLLRYLSTKLACEFLARSVGGALLHN